MSWVVCLEIGGLVSLYRYIIEKNDREAHFIWNENWADVLGAGCVLGGGIIGLGLRHWGVAGQLACGFLAAYLLVGSVTDLQTNEVYDFLPVITVLAGGLLAAMGKAGDAWPNLEKASGSLLLYLFLQFGLFGRMYGRADVYAFLVCALFEGRFGDGLRTYLWHMALTFFLLLAVQALKGNVNRRGNLRRPVALLPYIAVTVWCFL